MRALCWLAGLAVVAAAVSGIGRLRMDTDILAMLPGELAEVRGLRILQEEFARHDELVIWLECGEEEAGLLEEAAEDLAGKLEESGVVREARWRPVWSEESDGMAELVAYLWINGDAAELSELRSRLSPERIDESLEESLRRIATAVAGPELTMRAHDPFQFLDQPALREFIERQGAADGFGTADGRGHLVLVTAPGEVTGYKEAGAWIDEVRAVCADWQADGNEWVGVSFTGDPAFNAEIGSAIQRDISGTVAITSLLIGGLFLWMQRRLSLLAGLAAMLGLIMAITLGAAGWLHGSVGVVSAGFAAILIGLAVDYGVLICQEAKLAQHDTTAIKRAVGRSIVWAAITTAAVFAALNGSALPGIGQLGSLVALGILAGAVVMLVLYTPLVARIGGGRLVRPDSVAPFLRRRRAVGVGLALACLAAAVLAWRGTPGLDFDYSLMRPRHSAAMESFERIRTAYPEWGDRSLKLVIEQQTDEPLPDRLGELGSRLGELKEAGVVEDWWLPLGWWPDAGRQAANRPEAAALARDAERVLRAAEEAGFNEEGTALGEAVVQQFGRLADERGVSFPASGAAAELMAAFLVRSGRGEILLGDVRPVEGALEQGRLRELQAGGVSLAGWEALRPALLPLVKRDFWQVFLPMALVLVVMLAIVFRRIREVLVVVLGLAFSALVLCALMAAVGMEWSFLNVAAIPLLLGTGVDYGIHMLLALRRTGGDLLRTWNGTGKAIVFCGVSTAIGFGSLSFASNPAMAGMGAVCAMGILLNMGTAVFLLPGLAGGERGGSGRPEWA